MFCSDGSYPTVTSHTGTWALNPSSHSLDWSIPLVSFDDDTKSGTLEFQVGGDDAGAFFPVRIGFAAEGCVGGIEVEQVGLASESGKVDWSVDSIATSDEYLVV